MSLGLMAMFMRLPLRSGSVASQALARALGASALCLLAACAADKPKPAALETYTPTVSAGEAWNQRLGKLRFPMAPVAREGRFFVASTDGTVRALVAETGASLWQASAGAELSAGVGSDGRFASVVTQGNEVVTFEAGRELWRKRVPSASVTPPLVAGERVFVMTVDRVVHAFDALDGRRLWVFSRPGDALTLALPGLLGAHRNTLLVGQGARLVGLDPVKGSVQWDLPLASPRGTNEVERLADLLGPPVRQGSRVCARAFQSAVACVDAERGVLEWSRSAGGIAAVGATTERLFGADASDRITAWRSDNGDMAWSSEKLLNRGLSGAVVAGNSVLFGDREGYVHFLATESGEQQLRLPTDGSPIVGTPVVASGTVLVVTRDGGLFAFRRR
jgi:outer membrane protein assembly factor BamB